MRYRDRTFDLSRAQDRVSSPSYVKVSYPLKDLVTFRVRRFFPRSVRSRDHRRSFLGQERNRTRRPSLETVPVIDPETRVTRWFPQGVRPGVPG